MEVQGGTKIVFPKHSIFTPWQRTC